MTPPIRALLFDCDGLLVDTETPAYESWVQVFRDHGVELPLDRYQLDIGTVGAFDAAAELSRLTGKPIDRDDLWLRRQAIKLALCEALPLLPGVVDLLAEAQTAGLPMAVASSSDREWVEGWLERHAIRSFFHCVVTSNDVARVKPAPDLYLRAAECLGVPPAECLVFEDSPNGIRAAVAAGIRCIAVPGPMTADLAFPPVGLRLNTLADQKLTAILAHFPPHDEPNMSAAHPPADD